MLSRREHSAISRQAANPDRFQLPGPAVPRAAARHEHHRDALNLAAGKRTDSKTRIAEPRPAARHTSTLNTSLAARAPRSSMRPASGCCCRRLPEKTLEGYEHQEANGIMARHRGRVKEGHQQRGDMGGRQDDRVGEAQRTARPGARLHWDGQARAQPDDAPAGDVRRRS